MILDAGYFPSAPSIDVPALTMMGLDILSGVSMKRSIDRGIEMGIGIIDPQASSNDEPPELEFLQSLARNFNIRVIEISDGEDVILRTRFRGIEVTHFILSPFEL